LNICASTVIWSRVERRAADERPELRSKIEHDSCAYLPYA
jgi:hypothetical protein